MASHQVAADDFSWKEAWDVWDVRVIVLLSLFLQTFLLFSGPLRKKTQRGFVTGLIWTAYILSPFICSYGFGLINASIVASTASIVAPTPSPSLTPSPSPSPTTAMPHRGYTHPCLLGLWSPFLLLHLSRPDTITALSIEDNDLWRRKYLYLLLYSYYVGRTFRLSAIFYESIFWIPTFIVWIIGLKRHVQWIFTLFYATTVGPNSDLPKRPLLATTREDVSSHGHLSDIQVLKHAYRFFTQFKGLIVGYSYTFSKCTESRDFIIKLTPKDAFRVVERELNFFYELIYTEPWITKTKSSYLWRIGEFLALCVALLIFYKEDKSVFDDIDIKITFVLLGGSIFLEASAMIMVLSSDWFVAQLKSRDGLLKYIGQTWWPKIVHHRWSNSLPQYNLLKYCLHSKKKSLHDIDLYMITTTIESIRFVETLKFDEIMRDFIVKELQNKSSESSDVSRAREIQSAMGDWVIRSDDSCMQLLTWIDDCDFDQILVTWHVATDICFHSDNSNNNDRKISKWLSDYMFYLLIWQPEVMSLVDSGGAKRFEATSDEVRKFFHEKNIKRKGERVDEILNKACENILLGNYTEEVNGAGLSVLMNARNLAEKLIELEDSTRKWEILSKVWVEMLCYAASHCKASAHMKQIQQGGQLLTIVWLLMVHYGIVN